MWWYNTGQPLTARGTDSSASPNKSVHARDARACCPGSDETLGPGIMTALLTLPARTDCSSQGGAGGAVWHRPGRGSPQRGEPLLAPQESIPQGCSWQGDSFAGEVHSPGWHQRVGAAGVDWSVKQGVGRPRAWR